MRKAKKKYELLEKDDENGLHRIRALRDVPRHGVKAGEIGGFVESEENLSHDGNAWVADNAEVSGGAKVYDNAMVSGYAKVFGDARIFSDAWVYDGAIAFYNAKIYEDASVYGSARVFGSAQVCGHAWVYGDARLCGDAEIKKNSDWLCVGPIEGWSAYSTFFSTAGGEIKVYCGSFLGTLDEFEAVMKKRYGEDQHGAEYRAVIALARARFEET
jgi:hypothetical protein